MARPLVRALLVSLSAICCLVSCSSAHGPEEEIASGIYALSIRSVADGCSPRRPDGVALDAAVVSEGDLLSFTVADADGTRSVTLRGADAFHSETMVAMEGCEAARTKRVWTVVDRSRAGFDLELVEGFEGLAACAPMEGAPTADCEAVRELSFALVTACEAPCEVVYSASSGASCRCR